MNERWNLQALTDFLEASRGKGILTKHGGGKKTLRCTLCRTHQAREYRFSQFLLIRAEKSSGRLL